MDVNDARPRPHQPQCQTVPLSSNLQQLIHSLALQCLRSSKKILPEEAHRLLSAKYNPEDPKVTSAQLLEQFVSTLLAYTHKLKHEHSLAISKHDYEVLEQSVQKSQAEVRKHIKIEQQLKLYLDSLEERVQELQCKLELEQEKYIVLLESFKQLDDSHKKVSLQLAQVAEGKRVGQQYEFKSIDMVANQNVMSRKTKLGLKSRLVMEKMQQRTRKTNERKRHQLLSITQDEVSLQPQPTQPLKKGNSIDRYGKKEGQGQYSIKELTRSLQMKHERSAESYSKKITKTKTELGQKEARAYSIMN